MGTGEDRRVILAFDRGERLGGNAQEFRHFAEYLRRILVEIFEEVNAYPLPSEDFQIVLH